MIRKATINDIKKIHKLINIYSRKGLILYRPSIEIANKIRDYFVYKIGNKVIGCIALRIWNERSSEIYALAVSPKHIEKGIGTRLIKRCIADANKLNVPFVFALTFRCDIFRKLGFKKINYTNLPKIIFTEKTVNVDKAYGLRL